jgi:hypothetical protein
MKLSREGLKVLIKECIVEVLAEGVGAQLSINETQATIKQRIPVAEQNVAPRPRTEITGGQYRQQPHANAATRAPQQRRQNKPANILDEIFADTAKDLIAERVQEQRGEELMKEDRQIMNVDGEEVLNDWQKLAFQPVKPRLVGM